MPRIWTTCWRTRMRRKSMRMRKKKSRQAQGKQASQAWTRHFMMTTRKMITRRTGENRRGKAMTRFTDSPYEYMMAQKPSARQARETGSPSPPEKCRGCPYGLGRPCVGICMKDLMSGMGRKRRNHETDT